MSAWPSQWEGENGDSRTITYADLTANVKRAANVLLGLGIRAGDRVAIYLPMIPEAVVAMLAVARIGAVHSVVFGGFSADSIRSRIDDAEAKLVITADGGWRKGRISALKPTVDDALQKGGEHSVANVLVVKRCENDIDWVDGRDLWWHEQIDAAQPEHEAQAFPAENPLFILYTSGTTGNPKGIMHTSGGYLTQCAFTHKAVFDLDAERDVFWCTADVGWVTGRWWELIEKYRVSIFYTAPTAIRSFMKSGRSTPDRYDRSSIRMLGTVGEPINPEAWLWYREVIGAGRAPVVDTWWQTETGAIMVSPLPGVTSTKPWPAMLRGIWENPEWFIETYGEKFALPGVTNRRMYFAGDGGRRGSGR